MQRQECKDTQVQQPLKTAQNKLGTGFDSSHSLIKNSRFKPINADNIWFEDRGSFFQHEQSTDLNSCVEKIEKGIHASLDTKFLAEIKITADRKSKDANIESKEVKCHIVTHYYLTYCGLKSLPAPNNQLDSQENLGDSYINSGEMIIGYHLVMHTYEKSKKEIKNLPHHDLSFTLAKLNITYEDKNEKTTTAEQKIFDVVFIPIGGFKPKVVPLLENNFTENVAQLQADLADQQHSAAWYFVLNPKKDLLSYPLHLFKRAIFSPEQVMPLLPQNLDNKIYLLDEGALTQFDQDLKTILPQKYQDSLTIKDPITQEVRFLNMRQMAEVALEMLPNIPDVISPSMVIHGATGTGKSTLICHLLGIPLIPYENLGQVKAKIDPDFKSDIPYPEIGHSNQKPGTVKQELYKTAKGTIVIDAPGSGCVRGIEADIINDMALKILTKKSKQIAGLIIMINAHDLHRPYINEFHKSLYRLKGILWDMEKAIKQGSILFVIGNVGKFDADLFKNQIEKDLKEQQAGLAQILDVKKKPSQMPGVIGGLSQIPAKMVGAINKMWGVDDSPEIRDKKEKLSFVETLLFDFRNNFVVPNVFDNTAASKSREEILKKRRPLYENELMFGRYNDHENKFKNFFLAIATHANYKADIRMKALKKQQEIEHEIYELTHGRVGDGKTKTNYGIAKKFVENMIKVVEEGCEVQIKCPQDSKVYKEEYEAFVKSAKNDSVLLMYSPEEKSWDACMKTSYKNKIKENGYSVFDILKFIEKEKIEVKKIKIKSPSLVEIIDKKIKPSWVSVKISDEKIKVCLDESQELKDFGFEVGINTLCNYKDPVQHSKWTGAFRRSFWSWFSSSVTQTHTLSLPNLGYSCSPIHGEITGISAGEKDFVAQFVPEWWGYNSNPNVTIYQPACDRPGNILKIENKKNDKNELKRVADDFKKRIDSIEDQLRDPAIAINIAETLQAKKRELIIAKEKVQLANEDFVRFRPLYQLARKIFKISDLWSNQPADYEIINQFLNLFSKNIFSDIKNGILTNFKYDKDQAKQVGKMAEQLTHFEEFKNIAKTSNSVFAGLGLSREAAVSALLSKNYCDESRKYLAEEIKKELLSKNYLSEDKEVNNALQEFIEKPDAKSLDEQCQAVDVYEKYVTDYLGKTGWLGHKSILLIAEIKNFNVYFWRKNKNILEISDKHDGVGKHELTCHLLEVEKERYFNLLNEIPAFVNNKKLDLAEAKNSDKSYDFVGKLNGSNEELYFKQESIDALDEQKRTDSCGFNVLNTTREEFFSTLQMNSCDQYVKDCVTSQILNDFFNHDTLSLAENKKAELSDLKGLYDYQQEKNAKLMEEHNKQAKLSNPSLDELIQYFNNIKLTDLSVVEKEKLSDKKSDLQIAKDKFNKAKQNLDAYIRDDEVIKDYLLNNLKNPQTLGANLILAWAKVKNLPVQIWKHVNEKSCSKELYLLGEHKSNNTEKKEPVRILHTYQSTHFNRLHQLPPRPSATSIPSTLSSAGFYSNSTQNAAPEVSGPTNNSSSCRSGK